MIKGNYQDDRLSLTDNYGSQVSLSRLWINNMPAIHLKSFYSKKIPFDQATQNKESNGLYKLQFHDWNWWKEPNNNPVRLTIQSEKGAESWPLLAPPFLTILGLKIWIEKKYKKIEEDKDPNLCMIFFNDTELDNECTLSDYKVESGDIITFRFWETPIETSEQSVIGRFYPVEFFNKYVSEMQNKQRIVCEIDVFIDGLNRGFGTGFLIGNDRIITNDHVLADRGLDYYGQAVKKDLKNDPQLSGDCAYFYDEENNKISVPLTEVIYTSQSPGLEPLRPEKLDFCIVKFDKSKLEKVELERLTKLETIAESVFKELPQNYNRLTANVIHYPTKETTNKLDQKEIVALSKQISFRDNDVHGLHSSELHYHSGTKGGSSGALVLNDLGEFIGLHRASCNLIEIQLNKKWLELEKELKILLASKYPQATLKLQYVSGSDIRWCINQQQPAQGSLIKLLKHISLNYPGIIEQKKEEAWACQFLSRLNGEITNENMERTLQIKLIELKEEIEKLTMKENNYITLEEDTLWSITNYWKTPLCNIAKPFGTTNGNGIIELLEYLNKNFPKIFNLDSKSWTSRFLNNINKFKVIDDLEKHIYCNKATLASSIFSEINKIGIPKSSRQKPKLQDPRPKEKKPARAQNPIRKQQPISLTYPALALGIVAIACFACSYFKNK